VAELHREKQHLTHTTSATFQAEQRTSHLATAASIAAVDQRVTSSQDTMLEVKDGTARQSSNIVQVLQSNESQSAKLDLLLSTVCKGQGNAHGELASIQETVLMALARIQQLQEEFSKGSALRKEATSATIPASLSSPEEGETLMRVVDQQIIIRRNGKRELIACKDDEFEKATITQKKILVQVLLLSRLVARLSTRYGNMLYPRFRKDQFAFAISKKKVPTDLRLQVCSGVCCWPRLLRTRYGKLYDHVNANSARNLPTLKGKLRSSL
jgi:hypothetical protein